LSTSVSRLIDDIYSAADASNLKPLKKPQAPAKLPQGGEEVTSSSFRGGAQRRTRNPGIPGLALRAIPE